MSARKFVRVMALGVVAMGVASGETPIGAQAAPPQASQTVVMKGRAPVAITMFFVVSVRLPPSASDGSARRTGSSIQSIN